MEISTAIARQIAREHGFAPAFVHLENTSEADAETKCDTLSDLIEVVDPETGRTVLEQRNATASVDASAAAGAGHAKREADARFRTSSQEAVKLTMRAVGDPAQGAKCVIEIQGISAMLSGKYYVKSVKHSFGIKDATGRLEGGRASAAKPNLAAAKDPNELRPLELVDPETGRTELTYRRE
jgi:hypothetical protein